jgi:RNA polymerase sigma-70 factor, ECF subfamily
MNADYDPPGHLLHVQQLFIEHQPGLRALVLAVVRDFSLAQDVMQDVFLVVTRKAADFTPGTNFPAWAGRIARFESLQAMRRTRRLALSEETVELLQGCDAAEVPHYRSDWLRECLARLTPTVQRLIRLRYEDALKPAEIARVLGWTAGAVSVAASRARAELRRCIENRELKEATLS